MANENRHNLKNSNKNIKYNKNIRTKLRRKERRKKRLETFRNKQLIIRKQIIPETYHANVTKPILEILNDWEHINKDDIIDNILIPTYSRIKFFDYLFPILYYSTPSEIEI